MFLQVSVILFRGVVCLSAFWDTPPPEQTPRDQAPPHQGPGTPPDQVPTPQTRHPPCAVHVRRYGQQAGGTHPAGMQSCFYSFLSSF